MPPANHDEETEAGTPQGAVISPLLANIYLDPLDHEMVERGWEMVRYADDFVVLCTSRGEAEAALEAIRTRVEGAGIDPASREDPDRGCTSARGNVAAAVEAAIIAGPMPPSTHMGYSP